MLANQPLPMGKQSLYLVNFHVRQNIGSGASPYPVGYYPESETDY